MKQTILLCASLLTFNICSAKADVVNEVIRLTCADSLGYFELIYTHINGALASGVFANNPKDPYDKYGFIAVDDIDHFFDYDCRLNDKIYKIHLSVNNGNGCTGAKIPSITISQDNIVLVNNVPLADCYTYNVDMIKMLPGEGYIQFRGSEEDNLKYSTYFFENLVQLPTTQAFKE